MESETHGPDGHAEDAHSPFLDKNSELEIRSRHLPHWHLNTGFYYDTWRLGDALPQNLVLQWKNERTAWLQEHPQPWDASTRAIYRQQFPQRIESWLDAGYGECHLRDPACAQIVADAIHYFDGQRYAVASFVVMPNHVHLLFQRIGETKLEKVQHTWKSFTATKSTSTSAEKALSGSARAGTACSAAPTTSTAAFPTSN
jgi:hypothetical protein